MTKKIKSIYENSFMECKKCGVVTKNDQERKEHICSDDQGNKMSKITIKEIKKLLRDNPNIRYKDLLFSKYKNDILIKPKWYVLSYEIIKTLYENGYYFHFVSSAESLKEKAYITIFHKKGGVI